MRRFMLFLAAAAFLLTASAGPAAAYPSAGPAAAYSLAGPAAAYASAGTSCVSAGTATYRHTFDGAAGTATITAVRPLCAGQTQAFSLVSYTAPASASAGRFVYDTAHASISSHRQGRTLKVTVPSCDTRVYAVIGTTVANETPSDAATYGSTELGAPTGPGSRSTGAAAEYRSSGTTCATMPEVTFTNACDGTLTAAMSNTADANAKAVFVTGGRLIRVAPGHATKLTAKKGATLTIRASSFTSYVGTWRTPASACPAAATPTHAAPAPTAPTRAAVATTAVAARALSTPASTSSAAAEPTNAITSFNPAATAADKPRTALAQTGMGTGSMLAITLGLLMIGGGSIALTHAIRTSRRPL